MLSLSIAELRQNPTHAFNAVEAGESVLITRYRKPIAEINPFGRRRLPGSAPSGKSVMAKASKLAVLSDNTWATDLQRLRKQDEMESMNSLDAMAEAGW